jgi:hypothetical protein
VQDEPAWSISTTSGFPTSEFTAFDAGRESEQEYLNLARKTRQLQNPPEGQVLTAVQLDRATSVKEFRRYNRGALLLATAQF